MRPLISGLSTRAAQQRVTTHRLSGIVKAEEKESSTLVGETQLGEYVLPMGEGTDFGEEVSMYFDGERFGVEVSLSQQALSP